MLVIVVILAVSFYRVLETRQSSSVIFDAENIPFSLEKNNQIDKVNYNLLRQTWKESAWTNLISNIVKRDFQHIIVYGVGCRVRSATARFKFSLPLFVVLDNFPNSLLFRIFELETGFHRRRQNRFDRSVLYSMNKPISLEYQASDIRRCVSLSDEVCVQFDGAKQVW